MKFRFLLTLLLVILCFSLSAQERLVPLVTNAQVQQAAQKKQKELKTKTDEVSVKLPFFDDFSAYTGYPDPLRWRDNYAYVNTNYPLFPPTIGVVTLDGLNAMGIPYPQANTTYPFPTDTLTSQFIRLDTLFSGIPRKLTPADSVYMSFYYQPGGGTGVPWARTGITPNPSDSLVLEFYSAVDTTWRGVWSKGGFPLDSLLQNNKGYFNYVLIPITDTIYFTHKFQFRFRNYGSLASNVKAGYNSNSGQWHIDYVEVNAGRSSQDIYHPDFAFVNPAPSFLKNYQAMPAVQYDPEELKDTLDITISNLYNETLSLEYGYFVYDQNQTQVANYGSPYYVENINPFLPDHTYQTVPRQAKPLVVYQFPALQKNSKNEFAIKHIIRQGTDIRPTNDTVTFKQIFWNYFAYDDGSAENGYVLETKSNLAQLGNRFYLRHQDTLTSVELYFNQTLDSGNVLPFYLMVWDCKNGYPNKELYRSSEKLYPKFKELNAYSRYILEAPILVKDTIIVGFEQLSGNGINVGFDRNTSSAENIFYRVGNSWQNSFLQGSLMIRPYFGQAGAVVGISEIPLETKPSIKIYPNPVLGEYIYLKPENFVPTLSCSIYVYNIVGQLIETKPFSEQINVSALKKGIYLVKITDPAKNINITQKIVISK